MAAHWAIVPVSSGASTQEPITVSELKGHMRFPSTSDDTAIAAKLAGARRRIEDRTRRPYIKAHFDQVLDADAVPSDRSPIPLERFQVTQVLSVWSYNTEGSSSQFASSGYFLDAYSEPPRLCLHSGYSWPSALRDQVALIIRFEAGYTSDPATGIPDPLLEAVRKLATEFYVNREGSTLGTEEPSVLPYGIEDLIEPYVMPEIV